MPQSSSVNLIEQVVFTNKAHCRDCYRCLRVCPVKAIRMDKGQASVVAERCISCGTCIRECPQGAKSYRNDVDRAIRLMEESPTAGVSIAPSFVAVFTEWEQKRLPSALRMLGFDHVAETAIGAYQVAKETARMVAAQPGKAHICTACPAVVRYVERYDSEHVRNLLPLVSPMLAHARHIREKLGEGAKVVFIGPCVAKKAEAERVENKGLVDCALTFSELLEWFEKKGINLSSCEESAFDEEPEGEARYFPVVGGSVRTASLSSDLLAADTISASGFEEVRSAISGSSRAGRGVLVEPLFCAQGCVNGPAMPRERNIFERRREVLAYAAARKASPASQGEGAISQAESAWPNLLASFELLPVADASQVAEEDIRRILEKTGKHGPEDQLDCGACGYASCRDKAVAVLRGMAEVEMCIPYMKRIAEQRTDRIIETSPNGIVMLDERLNILSMNPTFRRFFMCSDAVCGQRISYLMDPDPFERVATGRDKLVETIARHERYNLVCHQIIYELPEEHQYVGIFVNITNSRANKEKLDHLREQTVMQARELLEHQIQMAQTIAKFLGESTAQGEELVEKLMELAGDEESGVAPQKRNRGIWDMFTAK